MRQPQKIDSARSAFGQRLHRSCHSVLCKITQERIACAQRQESQRDALNPAASRKHPVENFMSRAVTADRKKAPVALLAGLSRKLHRVPLAGRSDAGDLLPLFLQTY